MKLAFFILVFSALSETLYARPIPENAPQKSISISWRKYLPTLGALGLLGGLVSLVILGTTVDEAYKSAEIVTKSEAEARYNSLPPNSQAYLLQRMSALGEEMPKPLTESLEKLDARNGWPKMEMPDLSSMDKVTKNEIKSKYRTLQKAMNKVDVTREMRGKAADLADKALRAHQKAQFDAALIAGTEWREILEQAKGQKTKVTRM